jgi:iron(III) transport system permease protein
LVVTLAILLVTWEMYLLRGARLDRSAFGSPRVASLRRLGWCQIPAVGFCLLIFGLCTLLPAATSAFWMTRLFRIEAEVNIWPALRGSIQGSLPAAVLATAWAIPLAWLSVRYPSRLGYLLQRLPVVGYAVPALAFGLSLIVFCSAEWVPDVVYHALYQTLPLLVFAYTVHFLAEAVGPVRSSLMLASPRLEETSRALGRGKLYTMCWVTLPLLRHGLIVAAALVFLSCMKELPLTMLLSPPGMETLAQSAWDHTENAQFAQAAPYALTILVSSTLLVSLLLWERRTAGQ